MDKEKQIEDMATIMCGNDCEECARESAEFYKQTIEDARNTICLLKNCAKELYNEGYRKIPENEIVISKEEKQKLLKEMYEQGKFDAIADLEKEGKVVISKEEYEGLNNKSNETNYWKERAELAKSTMYNLRQDTVNEIADWLDNENGFRVLGFLVKKEFSVKARKYTTENQIKQARKETAEKILKELINKRHLFNRTHEIGFEKPRASYLVVDDEIEELAKEFGVDLGG